MTKEELIAFIDKVIGGKGILRVPAWWVRRLFNEIIGYTDTAISNIEIDVDSALSDTSENPVQNKVVKAAFDALSAEVVDNEEVTAAALNDLKSAVGNVEIHVDEIVGDINSLLDAINGEEI